MDSKDIKDRNSINNHINADANTDINTISTTNQVKEKLVDVSKQKKNNNNSDEEVENSNDIGKQFSN